MSKLVFHEDFDAINFNNDVALVGLLANLPLNGDSIRPVKLIAPNTVLNEGEKVIATGWGLLQVNLCNCCRYNIILV